MQTSQYEAIAEAFLADHPVGTIVTSTALQGWIEKHPDGAAIKPDLAIPDPGKRLAALKRHLNAGGQSDALPEARRFQLQTDDPKRRTMVVRSHADIAKEKATGAIGKSVLGALNPLKSSARAVEAVKLDELSDDERAAIQSAHENVLAMEKAVKPVLAAQVDSIWVTEMKRRGIPDDQARKIREALPVMTRMQKLLRATA